MTFSSSSPEPLARHIWDTGAELSWGRLASNFHNQPDFLFAFQQAGQLQLIIPKDLPPTCWEKSS